MIQKVNCWFCDIEIYNQIVGICNICLQIIQKNRKIKNK